MKKFTECKVKMKLGTVGDLVTEWMDDTQTNEYWDNHAIYIEELKRKGDYLKEVEITFQVEHDPLFDEPKKGQACESYRMDIMDMRTKK